MKEVCLSGKLTLREEQLMELEKACSLAIYGDNINNFSEDEAISRLKNAEIALVNFVTPITQTVLENCKNLKHIVSYSSGVNHIDLDACEKNGIKVQSFPGYCARTLAEKAFAFILMGLNKIIPAYKNVKDGKWDYLSFTGKETLGKKICILGMGASGKLLYRFADAFDMQPIPITSRSSDLELLNALKMADILSIHMSLNNKNIDFLNKEKLNLLKDDIVIINTARGNHVNEKDLYDFLLSNQKAIAFLDVLKEEPPAKNNPLLDLENVVITPHIGWNSIDAEERLANFAFTSVMEAIAE